MKVGRKLILVCLVRGKPELLHLHKRKPLRRERSRVVTVVKLKSHQMTHVNSEQIYDRCQSHVSSELRRVWPCCGGVIAPHRRRFQKSFEKN